MNKKILSGIILFQAAVLVYCVALMYSAETYSSQSILDYMDTEGGIIQEESGAWYVDEDSELEGGTVFLHNSDQRIGRGSYTISVAYEADWNHSLEISGEGILLSDSAIALGKGKNTQSISFRATQDIDDFEVRLYYSGKGYLKINDVTLVQKKGDQRENILLVAVIMVIADLYFMVLKRCRRFAALSPVIAGMVTGIAISAGGHVYEGTSFLDILSKECDGIEIEKLIVCLAVVYFFKKQWHLLHEMKSYAIRGIAVLFSVFMIIGISFSAQSGLMFVTGSFPQFLVAVLVFAGYYYLFRVLITYLFSRIPVNISIGQNTRIMRFAENHSFLLAVMFIFAGWLPYFIVFFPGSVQWDGLVQVNAAMGYSAKTTHHPWILSEFMGILMRIGQIVSDNAGVFLIGMTFSVIELLCYGFVCSRIRKYSNDIIYWGSVIYFAIVPAFPAFSNMVIKDGVNAALVAYFMALYIDCCVKVKKAQRLSIKDFVILGIAAMLVCVTRRNGIYLVFPQCLFLIVWVKERSRQVLALLLSMALLFGQYVSDVKVPAHLKIIKSSTGEMLSLPFQQTARYLLYAPDDITEEEKACISEVLPPVDYIAELYHPEISDFVKGAYNQKDENLGKYFKAWYSMLKKHPEIYIEATLEGSYGYFYPFRYGTEGGKYFFSIQQEPMATGDMYLHYLMPGKVRDIMKSYAELWLKIPVFSQIMNPASYTWMMLILAAYMLYKRKAKGILMYIAPAMNVLVCVASPVNGLIRYTLPLMACMPLMIGWCCLYCGESGKG